ncbi:non-ribosomal peptide synthase domain TIGR01720/amino acid adenylation domain-containing protein [Paraburkholderia fungorum]|uniref:Non-ribosomal peptide synthase domain TIGR01720/amino acid adenylation domain-containing protein n=1 Tax=Paraburkholderia fungorum TaxID=134537 RepID=A0A1H1HAL5_9BURK|nr:non-ribosomal peptide synthetase [Paraburkholderia fungorum]SDR22076.1 non-ribosomal peptide synthase domain TIGR01720/amino acid adenylation domain-containing protein [Paraburkholderia fungorum]
MTQPNPQMLALSRRYAALPPERRAEFRQRVAAQSIDPATLPVVPIAAAENTAPLSFEQEQLWFLWKLQPDNPAYHMPGAIELDGELDIAALDLALRHVARQHQSLMTRFVQRADGEPRQTIDGTPWPQCRVHDLRDAQGQVESSALDAALRRAVAEPFDLEAGPPMRTDLFRIGASRHVLQLTLHHIITDGQSMTVLIRALAQAYQNASNGTLTHDPAPDALQFRDCATWQREWLDDTALQTHIDYWRAQLGTHTPPSPLPFDRPRAHRPDAAGGRITREIDTSLLTNLQTQARAQGATLFMTLLAAFGALLYRYSSETDLRIGVPSSGRDGVETENLIGYFVNTLVVRQQLSGNLPFDTLLAQTRQTLLDAQAHRAVPFARLVQALQASRNDDTPLFHAMFSMQRSDRAALLSLPGLSVTTREIDSGAAQFDLSFNLVEHDRGARLNVVYASGRFDASTIGRLTAHYLQLLEQLSRDTSRCIADLSLSDDAPAPVAQQKPEAPRDVLSRITDHVRARPDAQAVTGETGALSYRELDDWSNRIARRLAAQSGASAMTDTRIGLCTGRSLALVAGALGILKAGAAYVPLDPRYPLERLQDTLLDSSVRCIVADADGVATLGEWAAAHNVTLIDASNLQTPGSDDSRDTSPLQTQLHPEQLAYVIYTSGSTGKPKGVGVTHANLARLFDSTASQFNFGCNDVWTLFHSHAFDFSVWELFGALVHGGRLVVVPYWTAREPAALQRLLREQRVTVLNQTPSAFNALMQADLHAHEPFGDVRVVVFGGERLEPAALAAWHRTRGDDAPALVNMYGITETTVHVTRRVLHDDDIHGAANALSSPIGSALDDLQLHLLDADLNPVPRGAKGELYVGGAGLARGYLNRPSLTAERFIPDPFGQPGARLYRSGDIARRLAGGDLAYQGRNDAQVKLRGFRIEPGEVRAALLKHPEIASAEVIAREHPQRGTQLIAYLVARHDPATLAQSARDYAAAHLPAHLVPSAFVVLDALPLTINGKLDRHALPAPDDEAFATERNENAAPLSAVGHKLGELWREVLGVAHVDSNDDFFARGGHSLLAVRLAARIEQSFGVQLPLRVFFDHPRLGALAAQLETAGTIAQEQTPAQTPRAPLERRPAEQNRVPLSHAQERLWFLWQYDPQDTAYNITCAVNLHGALDVAALRSAFDALSLRHEALRTSFGEEDGVGYQQIHAEPRCVWSARDLRTCTPETRENEVMSLLRAAASLPFDLTRDPLLRVTLIQSDDDQYVLHLTLHHIIGDGESVDLLIGELVALYRTAHAHGDITCVLPELRVQYGDYARWQRLHADDAVLDKQLAYWRGLLGETDPVLELPLKQPRAAQRRRKLGRTVRTLDAARIRALRQVADGQQASLFIVMLAAFDVLLQRYSGQNEIRVGVPVTGRTQIETGAMIGCFVNTLVMSADLGAADTFAALIDHVRQRALDAHAHADLPFARLVEALQPNRERNTTPLFQVMINYQQAAEASTHTLPGLLIEPLAQQADAVQFDLKLDIAGAADHARLHFDFADDIFAASTIERMADHFVEILDWLVAGPDLALRSLTLSAPKREAVPLGGYAFVPVVQRIAETASSRPDAIAVRGEGISLTYRELMAWASAIAERLAHDGVEPDSCVAVCVARGPSLLAAMLGVWMAGAAYLPVDPAYPADRIAAMLDDAEVLHVLADTHSSEHAFAARNVVDVRALHAGLAAGTYESNGRTEFHAPPALATIHPDQLAYVIYTSGSTGKPKGVGVTHGALDRLVASIELSPGLRDDDLWLSESAPVFDISLLEFCLPLVRGVPLEMVSSQTARDGFALAARLEASQATVFQATPSGWRMLLEAGWRDDLSVAHRPLLGLSGGEPLHPDLAAALIARGVSLWNLYGPTETTIYSSGAQVFADQPITHGDPLPETVLRVIDQHGIAVPDGGLGELCIGGSNLARGYLRRPGLTAERFVPDPDGAPGARLYRTGDLCRLNNEGRPQPLGRLDQQIKLRGFRIEPGEIEAALCACEGVKNAAVAIKGEGSRQRLIGYVTGTAQGATLRTQLSRTLPAHMLPSTIVTLDALPLTPSGKLDRRALPEPAWENDDNSQAIAPRSPREAALLDIWQTVLGHPVHSVDVNFFEAGGDSILSLQLISRVRSAGWHLTPKQVFEHPTIAQQAQLMTARSDESNRAVERHDALPLTPIQAAFFARRPDGESHWNQSVLLDAAEPLDLARLADALNGLVRRHDALRLRFTRGENGWQQQVAPRENATLLRHIALDSVDWDNALAREGAAIQQSLDIEHGPLVRAGYFEAGPRRRLLIAIHHLAVDGVSWRVLLDDLRSLYAGQPLSAPTAPWSAWVAAQASAASPDIAELDYWHRTLSVGQPALPAELMHGHRGYVDSTADRSLAASRTISVELDAAATRDLLQNTSHAYRTRADDLLLAALAHTLGAASPGDTAPMLIDIEGHGRSTPIDTIDPSQTVGWFTVQYPFALPRAPASTATFATTLIAVKEALRRVPEQGFNFGRLRDERTSVANGNNEAKHPQLAAWPGAQLRFNYLGQFDQALADTHTANPADNAPRLRFSHEFAGAPLAGGDTMEHLLDITALVVDGVLDLHWRFSPDVLNHTAVQHLAAQTVQALRELIAHCVDASSGATAADFPLARIDQNTLDAMRLPLHDIDDIYPATPLQQGLLFHSLLTAGAGMYLNQLRLTLDGTLDPRALQAAWQDMLDLHPVLRTHFELGQESGPLQVVHRQAVLPFAVHDWRNVDAKPDANQDANDNYETRLAQWLANDLRTDFDPSRAPLMRVALFARPDGAHDLVWTSHHALLDGWSSAQLLNALTGSYRSRVRDDASPATSTPTVAYRDYVRWLAHDDATRNHADWWRELSAEADEAALLTPSLGRPLQSEPGSHDWATRLPDALHANLQQAAQRAQVTLNTLMQGAWAILIARYGGRRRAAFGVTVSGRPADLPGVERMMGLFINSVPLWVDTRADAPTAAWLRELHTLNHAMREHEHTPITRIQQWTGRSGDNLFDTLFVFENYPLDRALDASDNDLTIRALRSADRTHYPLTLAVLPRERLDLQWAWDGERVGRASVERLAADYERVLTQLASAVLDVGRDTNDAARVARIGDIALSSDTFDTQPQRVYDFDPVMPRFNARAATQPDAIALACRGLTLSYRELDDWSARIGRQLDRAGLHGDQRVGVCVTRGVGLPAALFGIWKAGGAYVPLDPAYPRERLSGMLDDAGVRHVVADAACIEQLGSLFDGREVICIDSAACLGDDAGNPLPAPGWHRPVAPDQLAYVIYTSGSTGKPKGVALSHRALSLHLADFQSVYAIDAGDVVLQSSTINFDVALHELLPALLQGGRVEMRGPDAWDLDSLNATLVDAGVTFARIPTSLWQQWQRAAPPAAQLRALRQITVGGEALAGDTLARWLAGPLAAIRVDNLYGPTETAVAALYHRTSASDTSHVIVPIGRPYPGRGVALLDEDGLRVPQGGLGELCISGDCLARGYLGRPGLTAAQFVPDPDGTPGARLYRTGDLCRIGADGTVQFLGRIDQQIKLRGQRIEPGEIEAALRSCAGVTQALVALHGEGEHQRLIAYLVGEFDTATLQQTLSTRLPDAWMPGAFVRLDRLPLMPNGKLDRRALPPPEPLTDAPAVAPRDPVEQTIADIWQDALGVPQVFVHDNFYALGGHSLLAVQIAARLTRALQRPVPLATVLAQATVAKLADYLRESAEGGAQTQATQAAQRDTMKQLLAELD